MEKDALEKLGYMLIEDMESGNSLGCGVISKYYVRIDLEESKYEHIYVRVEVFDETINADVTGVYCEPYESGYKPFVFNYDEIKAINQIIDECEKQLRA